MADGLQNIGNILAGFGAGVQGRGPEFLQGLDQRRATQAKLSEERKTALVQDVAVGLDHLENDNLGMAIKLFEERVNAIGQLGGDATESQGTLDDLRAGRLDKVKDNLKGVVRAAQIRGILPETPTSKFLEIDKERGLAYFSTPEGVVSQTIAGLEGAPPVEDKEFIKEERKTASQDIRSFNTKAREMRTSFTKMHGLAEQAKTGSRGARNAMTVSLARLISPGIVTETEASALSGGQNTMQGIFQALSGKGFDITKLQTHIDPFGETFDAEGLLKVGESIVASGRQPLIDMFKNSEARAKRSGMSKKAFETNFLDNPNLDYLQSFQSDGEQQAPVAPQAPTVPGAVPAARIGRFEVQPL